MKDDNEKVLLEALAKDIAKMQKGFIQMSELIMKLEYLSHQISNINATVEKSTIKPPEMVNDADRLIDQRIVMDLKFELDRVARKLSLEDNLIYYFLKPGKVLLVTILIVLLSFTAGSFYRKYFASSNEIDQTEYYEPEYND